MAKSENEWKSDTEILDELVAKMTGANTAGGITWAEVRGMILWVDTERSARSERSGGFGEASSVTRSWPDWLVQRFENWKRELHGGSLPAASATPSTVMWRWERLGILPESLTDHPGDLSHNETTEIEDPPCGEIS